MFRQELNLGFVKGQTYKLQNKVDEIKTGVHVSSLSILRFFGIQIFLKGIRILNYSGSGPSD